ncbi:RNA polymerase sigma-70 factor, ECF subfamily protein [unidentified eubacterium SCB49]|nr:RNA polymerase sigma-70 factor, ECF subfamily protein [unidentified eubacterium SCB49]
MNRELQDNVCEKEIFDAIYLKYAKNIRDFLYYKYGSHLHPQDKMQEAFIKLWENCKKVTPSKAKSFLFTTANNLTINEYNHQKVVLKFNEQPQKTVNNETPEFVLREKEHKIKIEQAIASLTEAERVAFLLNRVEGKRFKEVAALLDISVKAVEKRVYGALKKIREEIDGI